ncbi:hypothetical protein B4144_3953 [Bacillus atrophaeus]|nr:hypothetical protein B4144_3953 [Bacillus atrophaeus]
MLKCKGDFRDDMKKKLGAKKKFCGVKKSSRLSCSFLFVCS